MKRVLKRYDLLHQQQDLAGLYLGAVVWRSVDIEQRRDVTVITYSTAEGNGASTTKRRLWATEVRKLIRLSCQPFDPSLIGFIDGGYDAESELLVLVMDPLDLPSIDSWFAGSTDTQACLMQWRGNHGEYRAEIWHHIECLFRALSAVHESRIVHRRINLGSIFVDESLSRDQAGFLKMGRFEASSFFHAARRHQLDNTDSLPIDEQWYLPMLPDDNANGLELAGSPAGDVYSTLLVVLWLLTGRPNNRQDVIRFRKSLIESGAIATRKSILKGALESLPTAFEREFFQELLKPRFPSTALASSFERRAKNIVSRLRETTNVAIGPLCVVASAQAADSLGRLLAGLEVGQTWDAWLPRQLNDARLVVGECDSASNKWQCKILLPNGWVLLCAVFKSSAGTTDWKRLSINNIDERGRTSRGNSLGLSSHEFRLLSRKDSPPSSARSWRAVFDEMIAPTDIYRPAEQALEYLNLAELSFWEENVVPVEVVKSEITWKNEIGTEEVVINQLTNDAEMPLNPLVRKQHVPDFSLILQDKEEVRVKLSSDNRLWDRENDRTVWLKAEFDVREIPSRDGGEQRTLTMYREGLTRTDTPTQIGKKAWFKTQDQGWQMGIFRRRWKAIEGLRRHAVLSDLLRNPRSRHRHLNPIPLDLRFENWSEEKTRLVSHTMTTAPLFLVQGPPGTGKSTYVAGLMQHILSAAEDPYARILVAAHMHFAIDHLAERVKDRFAIAAGNESAAPIILRLCSTRQADSRVQLKHQANDLLEKCCDKLRDRSFEPLYADIGNALAHELNSDITSELAMLLTDAASILLTTCTDKCLDSLNNASFDWVIIEEAGRVVGCDLVIPMRLGHRWVLIGDPKQLGPYRQQDFRSVVNRLVTEAIERDGGDQEQQARLSNDCEHLLGPFESFFDGTPPNAKMMLKQQHRMHPDICRIVSDAFYESKLVDSPDVDCTYLFPNAQSPFGGRAVVWIDVPHLHWSNGRSTEDVTESGGYSICNSAEIDVTRCILSSLTSNWSEIQCSKKSNGPFEIAAIAPYRYQVRRLRTLIQNWPFPVGLQKGTRFAETATAFQGQEADVVILNMVRNNARFDMGFLDAQQLNVALSRAQKLLIVVGCFDMLRQTALSSDQDLQFCQKLVDALEPHVLPAVELFPEIGL
jgi:hypothetical protein